MQVVFWVLVIIVALIIAAVVYVTFEKHKVGAVITGVIGILALVGWWYTVYGSERTVTIHVTHTERLTDGDSSRWMVFSNVPGIDESFQNTDALFHGKTDSTDMQRHLVVGDTYICVVNGFRISLWSRYRNIIHCESAASD